ncbi:hypothetical protein [Aliiroseovarius halocynthiae]|uniref:Uncharacterized protein n=1 Tax=Aliiroseovarius halocynthiae TaxID=985055 RepID=A0A545SVY6_9RHOB|nr:hypothetical protein [Aliiroseovarius halocynthiae]TQV69130.1 hypothetical protein FIL88_06055 [Aliiroseovarius halocynthiae]
MTFLTKTGQIAVAATLALPLALAPMFSETSLTVAVKSDRYSIKTDKFTFTTRRPAAQNAKPAVRPDANFNPSPPLFSGWDYADKVYTVTLQGGMNSTDGTP